MPDILIIDDPARRVRRLTLNRPEKRNALSNELRAQVFAALEAADNDPEIRVTILRGAGSCFSAGYDLGGGAAIYDTSPLQRRFRDAHTATAHFQVNLASFELTGRLLLGQPARTEQL